MRRGFNGVIEVPAARWDIDAWFDEDRAAPGKMTTRWGGFLEHVDSFDARFFGISPREARQMDPQQRLMLEVAWESLEDAGVLPARLEGTSRLEIRVGERDAFGAEARWTVVVSLDMDAQSRDEIRPARLARPEAFRSPARIFTTSAAGQEAICAPKYLRTSATAPQAAPDASARFSSTGRTK